MYTRLSLSLFDYCETNHRPLGITNAFEQRLLEVALDAMFRRARVERDCNIGDGTGQERDALNATTWRTERSSGRYMLFLGLFVRQSFVEMCGELFIESVADGHKRY